MSKKCDKNAIETFKFEQASYETYLSYKIFILLVLALAYHSFLQITRGNFIRK